MQDLAIKALDQDLAAEFQKDPNPVALQAALQIQLIRLMRHPMIQLEAPKQPQPNPPGHKKGKGNH